MIYFVVSKTFKKLISENKPSWTIIKPCGDYLGKDVCKEARKVRES